MAMSTRSAVVPSNNTLVGDVTGDGTRGRVPTWLAFLLAGLVHALLTMATFPPVGWWWLAVAAPMPLVWAALRAAETARPARAAAWSALGVLPLWVFEERWLIDVAGLWYVLLAGYLAIYAWAFVGLSAGVVKRLGPVHALWAMPLIWTGLEVVRGEHVWGGYAWYLAGQPLIEWWYAVQVGSVIGQYGVSLLVVSVSVGVVSVVHAWREGRGASGAGAAASDGGSGGGGRAGRRAAPLATALFAIMLSYGASWVLAFFVGAPVRERPIGTALPRALHVGVVQTNVATDNKQGWTVEGALREFAELVELTRRAAAAEPRPDLIVWPETMFPGSALNDDAIEEQRRAGLVYRVEAARVPESLRGLLEIVREQEAKRLGREADSIGGDQLPLTFFPDALRLVQRDLGVAMVVGATAVGGLRVTVDQASGRVRQTSAARYNSAFIFDASGRAGDRYDKVELMAFGEVVPYVWRFPQLSRWIVSLGVSGWEMDLAWGKRAVPLRVTLGDGREVVLGTPICFEGTMTRVGRLLGRGADVLVNLTNDGWFGAWRGCREAHLLATRWRCVELGLPMVRSANTGISCVINEMGEVTGRLQPNAAGVLAGQVLVDVPGNGVQAGGGGPSGSAGGGGLAAGWQGGRAEWRTPYARFGNVVGVACLIGTGGVCVWLVLAHVVALLAGARNGTQGRTKRA